MVKTKGFTGISVVLAMILILAVTAGAQNVRWSPSGLTNLTQDGWTLATGQDFSSGYIDGKEAVWHINDNSGDSMKIYKDPGIMSSTQGIIIARIKYISGSAYAKGTFGYTSATGNHSVMVAVRNGQINIKTCVGTNTSYNDGDSVPVPGGTDSYRVYALKYYIGGAYDLWVSNGSNWSSSSADWTKLISNGTWDSQTALLGQNDALCTGLVIGSFEPGETWNGYIDYIAYSANNTELTPWSFEPNLVLPDDAQYISDTIPTIMEPGRACEVSVTMKNNGLNAWTKAAGYKLDIVNDSSPFHVNEFDTFGPVNRDGKDSIAAGQQKTFNFTMTAPKTTGTYTTDWRMVKGSSGFGIGLAKKIIVMKPDSAKFISDTIPVNMTGDHQYTVSVTMQNTSLNAWTKAGGYKLSNVNDSDPFCSFNRVELADNDCITPGGLKTFTFTLKAPSTGGTLTTNWQMVNEAVGKFGDPAMQQIAVQGPPERLVVDDPLTGASPLVGTRICGGISPSTFGTAGVIGAEGWQCTQRFDAVYYHLDTALSRGKVEFEVKGIRPNETTGHMRDKTELFHMYDYTKDNADNTYGGYRGNKYKMFIRKIGAWDAANPEPKADKFEMVYIIAPAGGEPDSKEKLAWDPNVWNKFVIEWGPDGTGNTPMQIRLNGSPVTPTMPMLVPGFYEPEGHSVRFGASTKDTEGSSAPIGGTYRNIRIWQIAPIAPVIVKPVNSITQKSKTPIIEWVSEKYTQYQVRVCTSNDPDKDIVWDSGVVTSGAYQTTVGKDLTDKAYYYVFVKIANTAGWSDWSAPDYRFRVDTAYNNPRTGNVVMNGNCLADDGGPFLGLGASYMRALQRCKYDKPRFKRDLSYLASKGVNYIRILTMVGWEQMEIAPVDITKGTDPNTWILPAWPDYWQQFRDMIDIAYDEYGLRSEVTIFADSDMLPDKPGRIKHIQAVLDNLVGREHKIMHLEVANEAWQNGFSGSEGIADLREFGKYLTDRTSIPVALSAPYDSGSASVIQELYQGSTADITTVHLSRDMGSSEGGWLPVRDAWRIGSMYPSIPPASSNEPLGPGSSVNTENDPIKIVSAASFAWISNMPMYVFHSRSGTSSIDSSGKYVHFEDMPGLASYPYLLQVLPPDLPNWTRNDGIEESSPFTVYCNGQPNKYWTEVNGASSGCHRNIGAKKGSEFVCQPQGILAGGVTLKAKQTMSFTVYNPLTGAVVMGPVTKNPGDEFTLPQGPGAYIIRGTINTSP